MIDTKIWLSIIIVIVICVAAAGYQISNQTTGLWQPIEYQNPVLTDQNNPTSNSPYGSGEGGSGNGGTGTGSGTGTGGNSVKITVQEAQNIAQNHIEEAGATAGTPKLVDNKYVVPIMLNGEKVGAFIIDAETGEVIELQGVLPLVKMVETEVECCKIISEDVEDAIVLEGSPELGLIGNIVGWLLVEELKMNQIGHIDSKYFPPMAVLYKGVAMHPFRIYSW